ncbi:MAG: PBS lyase [Deltaproteobacteria bacterium]|nr:MAG: PBS lyase [Deltaproteobacteria bacterium]
MSPVVGRFQGRDVIAVPQCPFCEQTFSPPTEEAGETPREMPVGRCLCGAAYAYDATGHNLGSAMIEALVCACHGDWDHAWDLLPGEDYLERQLEHYDLETHKVISGGVYEGRRIAGTLYFIRLHEPLRKQDASPARNREYPVKNRASHSSPRKGRKSFSKREVESLVRDYRLDAVVEIARTDARVIASLKRLLYAVDRILARRAAEALGLAGHVIAREDPSRIARLLQGLISSLTDSAASAWGSLDAIGEIIYHSPNEFAGYIPQLYALSRDRALLPEILRSLEMISRSRSPVIRKTAFQFVQLLRDEDPRVVAYAAMLLGNLGATEAREELERLKDATDPVEVYEKGRLIEKTLGLLASEALDKL